MLYEKWNMYKTWSLTLKFEKRQTSKDRGFSIYRLPLLIWDFGNKFKKQKFDNFRRYFFMRLLYLKTCMGLHAVCINWPWPVTTPLIYQVSPQTCKINHWSLIYFPFSSCLFRSTKLVSRKYTLSLVREIYTFGVTSWLNSLQIWKHTGIVGSVQLLGTFSGPLGKFPFNRPFMLS